MSTRRLSHIGKQCPAPTVTGLADGGIKIRQNRYLCVWLTRRERDALCAILARRGETYQRVSKP